MLQIVATWCKKDNQVLLFAGNNFFQLATMKSAALHNKLSTQVVRGETTRSISHATVLRDKLIENVAVTWPLYV